MAQEIRIPRLGWSMEEGIFLGWLKKAGDAVAVGDALYELEGEKATQQIEAVDAGILYIPADAPEPGSTQLVGARLGFLLAPGEGIPGENVAEPVEGESAEEDHPLSPPAAPSVRRLARELGVDLAAVAGSGRAGRITSDDVTGHSRQQSQPAATGGDNPSRPVASPRARRVAKEIGIDWTRLRGTGRGGRIREADVRAAFDGNGADSAASAPPIPLSARRLAIAQRLKLSRDRTLPVTLTTTVDATALVRTRTEYKLRGPIVPAYTDLVACLAAQVLLKHPHLAVRWAADHKSFLPTAGRMDIGIAVDTPDGLLVPVLRDVGRSTPVDVARQSQSLIASARAGRLTSAEMQGGAFTITNLGAYGIDAFTPIINYPEIAILGLGRIRREPTVSPEGWIGPQERMTLSLTFDHAAVDGAPAAAFLRDLAAAIESCD